MILAEDIDFRERMVPEEMIQEILELWLGLHSGFGDFLFVFHGPRGYKAYRLIGSNRPTRTALRANKPWLLVESCYCHIGGSPPSELLGACKREQKLHSCSLANQ